MQAKTCFVRFELSKATNHIVDLEIERDEFLSMVSDSRAKVWTW